MADDIYSTIRGDCDGCPEKYCTNRNHHELSWFLCRNPNKPKHPARRCAGIAEWSKAADSKSVS